MHKDFFFKIFLAVLVLLNLFFLGSVIVSQFILKGETVLVPDLTGKTVSQARTALTRKDLSLATRGTEFSDTLEKGLIISQDPPPDSPLRVTGAVRVVISGGSRMVKVPKMIGKSLENSMTMLKEAGLTRGFIAQIHTGRFPAGRVIAQKPDPDSSADRHSLVNLLISQGGQDDLFIMPDLINRKADSVAAKLKAAGFQVAELHYVYYPGQPSGVVVNQDPPFGYRIQKRSRISLEVSR